MSITRFKTAWNETVGKVSPGAALVGGVFLLLVMSVLDWFTKPPIGSSIFYLIPITLVTWKAPRWVGLSMALASGVIWLAIELVTNKSYTNIAIPLWNGAIRIIFFCLVAGLMAEVLERKRIEQSLRESERRVAEASEREQRRIGEDLHDGLCQQLVGAAFAARKLAAQLSDLSLPETKDATEIAELLGESISQARDAARGLYLVELEADGLIAALEELAIRTQSRCGIACQFIDNITIPIVEVTGVTSLFRIAQEAVNNAVKHAKASRIIIRLAADAREIRLDIEDDGRGLTQGFENGEGMGLQIMNYRARMIGGSLTIDTGSLGGVGIICSLPRRNLVETSKESTP